MKTGLELIADERERQISEEGWTAQHDDGYTKRELMVAAECYRRAAHLGAKAPLPHEWAWPWEKKWWKPSDDPVRNLVKAGALFLAQEERAKRFQHTALEQLCRAKRLLLVVRIDRLLACPPADQVVRINLAWDGPVEARWVEMTPLEYQAKYETGVREWREMLAAGAVEAVPV